MEILPVIKSDSNKNVNLYFTKTDCSRDIGFKYNVNFDSLSTKEKLKGYTFSVQKLSKTNLLLKNQGITPVTVAPNTYNPDFGKLSVIRKDAQVKFSKQRRFQTSMDPDRKHDSYADYSAIGNQIYSKKKTETRVVIPKMEKSPMGDLNLREKKQKLNLPHANY